MNIPFSPPDISQLEIDAVTDALKSGWITTGPKTKAFEQALTSYIGCARTVCLQSQTIAAELTLRILGIGPGDEVIIPAYTYTASASVVDHVGAKLVMIDSQTDDYEMDYDQLEAAITERTKAIIPVDLAGVVCDYDRIYEIIERMKHLFQPANDLQRAIGRIVVMSDTAHALGATAKGKMAGTLGDFSCFSFHAVKNLTTAEGGCVSWTSKLGIDDDELYRQYMLYSLHGQTKDALSKNKPGAWEYDIVFPGYKANMTDIMASIGLSQLSRYDALLARRAAIVERYDAAFKSLPVYLRSNHPNYQSSCFHLYMMRLKGATSEMRNQFIEDMAVRGIACNVHYKPLPMLTAYRNLGFDIHDYPNAEQLYINEVTLPLHTQLTDQMVDYVIEQVVDLLGSKA